MYYYNRAGRLEYIYYDGTPASVEDLKFTYDGLGRRITVQRGTAIVNGGQVIIFTVLETKKYVYLGGFVIRELDASNNVLREYIRGLHLGGGIGGIIYQKKGSDYYYYHYNHKGDVVALTDGNGKLAAYYEYDAWGNTMTEAGTWESPYRFSTKEWDEKAGLYYFGARYYSPEGGRWTQRDPLGTVDGLNLYLYAGGEPVSRVDPTGLWDEYVHYDLTVQWAVAAGIDDGTAKELGACNQGMDDPDTAWDSTDPLDTMRGDLWHRCSSARLNILKGHALATCNLWDFCAYLHCLQDTPLHRRYSRKRGHGAQTVWHWAWDTRYSPDDWFNPRNASLRPVVDRQSRSAFMDWSSACCGKVDRDYRRSWLAREVEIMRGP